MGTQCFSAELILESVGDDHEELEGAVQIALATLGTIKKWMDENMNLYQTDDYKNIPEMKTFCKEDLQSFRSKMFQIRNRMKDVRNKKNELAAKMEAKFRLGIGLSLRKYLVDNEQTSDQLFNNGDELDLLSLEEFLKRCEKVGMSNVPQSVLQRNYNLHSCDGMTKEQFKFLCTPRMICCKPTSITEGLEIKSAKNLMMIPLHDIVEVIGEPEEDAVSKVTRVRAQKVVKKGEESEIITGYITLKGITSGTVFFEQYKPYFEVIKATVLTSLKEMKGFKVVGQLKCGDMLSVTDIPQKEGDLLRVECTKLGESTSGWCTMLTSSSTYLQNRDLPSEEVNELIEAKKTATMPTVIPQAEDVEMTPVEESEIPQIDEIGDVPMTSATEETSAVKEEITEETEETKVLPTTAQEETTEEKKEPVKEEMIEETEKQVVKEEVKEAPAS